jgi:DNA-binding NtrC family response regulator
MHMTAHTVLVIEDHEELRDAICALLVRSGYAVRTADDAEDAVLELASIERPCLVLWDPVSRRMSLSLLAQVAFDGIHIAILPIGIAPSAGTRESRSPGYTKKLTSQNALMSIVKEHCAGGEPA